MSRQRWNGWHGCDDRRKGVGYPAPFLAALLASACVLWSCGGEARLVSPTFPAASPQSTPAMVATPGPATPVPGPAVAPIVWATAVDAATQAPSAPVTSFADGALTIYACALVNNLGQGTAVEASWTYNGTSLDAFGTQLVLPDDVPQRWLAFHIARDPNVPWPAGTYAISIAVNGNVLQSATVEITATG